MLVMLATVTAAVGTGMRRDDGGVLLAGCVGASLVLYFLGGGIPAASAGLGPVLMILGYAAVGVAITAVGVTELVPRRFGFPGGCCWSSRGRR